jgi:AraC family transcriptional regulator
MALLTWQVRRVVNFVEARLDARLSVADVAGSLSLSTSHFCREFKLTFGVTVHTYVMRRRIEVAQHLMLTTADSLSEIALRCGLCDQAHFTRWHRRVSGATPSAWRRGSKESFSLSMTG